MSDAPKQAEWVALKGDHDGAHFEVMTGGAIKIEVGGSVHVRTAREWHALAVASFTRPEVGGLTAEQKEINNLRERLRLAMNFMEEWSNWWSYALEKNDNEVVTAEEDAAATAMAEGLGHRAAEMVIQNRRALATSYRTLPSPPAANLPPITNVSAFPAATVSAGHVIATKTVPADLWDEIADFITDQVDVRDGADGPVPNKAMHLSTRIDQEVK